MKTIKSMDSFLIEAESFEDFGGWKLDTQFIHSMGSPYLLAHGLGKPVAPAQTSVTLPAAGTWFVWARTKNWAAGPWEAPGRFHVVVNGRELAHVFGTGEGAWNWACGGAVELDDPEGTLSLINLTGFEGRCDAIFLTQDEKAVPDNSSEPMNAWRRRYGREEDALEKWFTTDGRAGLRIKTSILMDGALNVGNYNRSIG